MSFASTCPHCGAKLRLLDKNAGKKIRCSDCNESYVAGGLSVSKGGPKSRQEVEDDKGITFQQVNFVQVNQQIIGSGPQVRCHDCNRFFDPEQSTRWNGRLGVSVDSHGNRVEHYGDVDVCPECNNRRDEAINRQKAAERDREDDLAQITEVMTKVVGGIILVVLLIYGVYLLLDWFVGRFGSKTLVFTLLGIFSAVVLGVTIYYTNRMNKD
jgi:hypothetical protein